MHIMHVRVFFEEEKKNLQDYVDAAILFMLERKKYQFCARNGILKSYSK